MKALGFILFTKVGSALFLGGLMLVLLYVFVLIALFAFKKLLP